MLKVSDEKFQEYINAALATLPKVQIDNLKNVAILLEDEPTPEQREELKLHGNQTLLGLYQGVPLTKRQGTTTTLPDKITLFKKPILAISTNEQELKEQIHHTLWHEIAHYHGLDHERIHELEH